MKKFCSLLLAMLILCAAVPASVVAEEAEDVTIYYYIGEKAIAEGKSVNNLREEDVADLDCTDVTAFNSTDIAKEISCSGGGDITGWHVWTINTEDYTFVLVKTVDADFTYAEFTEEEAQQELLLEPVLDVKYTITTQPTASFPFIGTNKTPESIKWVRRTVEFADEKVVETVEDEDTEVECGYCWCGVYNAETGLWESEYADDDDLNCIDMSVILEAGDKLTVTVSEGFDGGVYRYPYSEVFEKNGNVYTYTHDDEYDNDFNFYVCGSTDPFTIEVEVSRLSYVYTDIAGQTADVYTGEGSCEVLCEASFEDGKYVLRSDVAVLGDYWFVQQPTEKDPIGKVNKPDDVEGWQWYTYKEEHKSNILVDEDSDEDGIVLSELTQDDITGDIDENEIADIITDKYMFGSYVGEGVWKGNVQDAGTEDEYYMLEVSVGAKMGDRLKVEVDTEGEYETMVGAVINNDFNALRMIEEDDDGGYTVPENGTLIVVAVTCDAEFTADFRLETTDIITTAVTGQTADKFSGESGTYVVEAIFSDDVVVRSVPVKYTKAVEDNHKTPNTGMTETALPAAVLLLISSVAMAALVLKKRMTV